ncbi:MAG: hypothetical protein V3R72_09915 [Gammaproteobacteria bacterium]|jgi:hypothetical protein
MVFRSSVQSEKEAPTTINGPRDEFLVEHEIGVSTVPTARLYP